MSKKEDLEKAIVMCKDFIRNNEGNPELKKMVSIYKDILKDNTDDYIKLIQDSNI